MSEKITDSNTSLSVSQAREHYNHLLADKFYKYVWADDDIFIGLGWYDDDSQPQTIAAACQCMVDKMVKLLPNNQQKSLRLLDLGSGYGATARYLVQQYDFQVDCLNLSEIQNTENQYLNYKKGLNNKVQVFQGNFESLEFNDQIYNVVWSQDSFLHSDQRSKILAEIDRVLAHGGSVIFSDILQNENCSADDIKSVLSRFGLNSLATSSFYTKQAQSLNWQIYDIEDISSHLIKHYQYIIREIDSNYDDLLAIFEADYLVQVRAGMMNWIKAGEQGYLKWGLFHFRKNER